MKIYTRIPHTKYEKLRKLDNFLLRVMIFQRVGSQAFKSWKGTAFGWQEDEDGEKTYYAVTEAGDNWSRDALGRERTEDRTWTR